MSDPTFVDLGSQPYAITEIHAWIAIQPDGTEGIMSATMPSPLPGVGMNTMPLLSSNRLIAEELRPMARRVQRESFRQGGKQIVIELRTFTTTGRA